MTKCCRSVGLLLIATLCLRSQFASGTGVPVTSGGAFIKGAADDLVQREWVGLEQRNGLFTGWPADSSVGLITIYAPGADADHLILRELVSAGRSHTILLSAPESLKRNTKR